MLPQPSVTADRRLFDVVRVLFSRTLRVRYRGSALGILWSAVNPLGMGVVYAAIFGHTFAVYYDGSVLRYAAAVYIGLTLIGFFISGTTQALPTIVQNGGLLNKIRIPFEAFPLAAVAAYGFQQVAGTIPILVLLTLVVTRSPLHLVLLFIPLIGLAMLATGVGLFVSGAHVFFRDVPYLYELATFLLWLTSPVFYPVGIIPEHLARFLAFNPLYPILESTRTLVLTPSLPDTSVLVLTLIDGALALAIGAAAFKAMSKEFMDLL